MLEAVAMAFFEGGRAIGCLQQAKAEAVAEADGIIHSSVVIKTGLNAKLPFAAYPYLGAEHCFHRGGAEQFSLQEVLYKKGIFAGCGLKGAGSACYKVFFEGV